MRSAEATGVNASAAGTLLAGSVVTVDPASICPPWWRRIEDTLAVAEEASGRVPELLTRFPKELAVLD